MMAFKVLSLYWLSLVGPVHAILAKPDCSSPPLASNDVCNTALTPSQRAAALTAALTVEEKVGNLVK